MPALESPLRTLEAFVINGGKRLRPAFCYWAFVGGGGSPSDPAIADVGAALEILHAFALIHDDVMDRSALRRGQPSVNETWRLEHIRGSWRGASESFGNNVAILIGDLAFVYAQQLMPLQSASVREVFAELQLELHAGQFLDILGTAQGAIDQETARMIAVYKSAKYTVERPLHLGAALSQSLPRLREPLTEYGVRVGAAFQLRDDLLGVFGDPSLTGKPVGEDLVDGKPTLLHVFASERATGTAAKVLDRCGSVGIVDEDISRIQEIYTETGARQEVEHEIELLIDAALDAIRCIDLTQPAGDALADLAVYIGSREV